MDLGGKTVLLTGGTDGIGRELALQLRAQGATVIVTGRTPERLADMAGQGFETIAAELSGPAGVEAVPAALGDRPVDVLINNAGAGSGHDFRVAPPDLADNDGCIFLNLHAPIHLITRLMSMLQGRPEAMIVNVTSGLAIAPRSGAPVYCATKAGLRSYTQALRAQLAGTRIHVLEALPPVVETKMTAGRNQRKMPAAECARQILVAMQRNAPEANVGLTRLLRAVYSVSPALARTVMLRY